ncbi:alanine racemase [Pseudoalteromonas 'SMAR']|uniref:alanine racemase n=1 Tax=Pseudoalteromonas 'SMAR' TaxID=3416908 RepID=UPI003AF245D0
MRLACAEIDLTALQANLKRTQQMAPNSKIMAVLKANAYGHGLVKVAQHLNEADAFAVARIDEALALRAGGITKPIVLLEGFFHASDLPILLANNLQTIVHNIQQLEAIEQAQLDAKLTVWLKVDTGMHRLGVEPSEFLAFHKRLKACANVADTIHLMTHFACADDKHNDQTQVQQALFTRLVDTLSGPLCLANSAAVIGWPQTHGDWIRPGLMLYGISPMQNGVGQQHGLQPVMRLTTKVIAIRQLKANSPVGYGGRWQSPCDTQLAIIGVGYGDGYPRHAQCGTPVVIRNKRYGIVGSVSMDMISVDIGANRDNIKVGDEVEMWGPNLAVEEVARCAGTIPYELLCNVTPRVSYEYC